MEFLPQRQRGGCRVDPPGMNRQQRSKSRLHDCGEIFDPLFAEFMAQATSIAHHRREIAYFGPHLFGGKSCQHGHYTRGIVQGRPFHAYCRGRSLTEFGASGPGES